MYVEAAAIRLSTLELDRAFEVSVLPERGRLFALALVITRDRSAAEDAVQETLLAAWKAWPTVRDPYRPGGWLTRICVNHCIRRRHRLSPPVALDDASRADVTARRQIELGGDLVDFDRAFGLLTDRQRARERVRDDDVRRQARRYRPLRRPNRQSTGITWRYLDMEWHELDRGCEQRSQGPA